MKTLKSFSLLLGVLLIAFLSSCTKDDPQNGEFTPGKRIHNIYIANPENESERRLIEAWHWNGNKLESIDYYQLYSSGNKISAIEKFTYNGDLLTRIDNDFNRNNIYYTLFKYENNKLAFVDQFNIQTYTDIYDSQQHIDTIKDTFTLNYQDEKLSQITRFSSFSSPSTFRLTWENGNLNRIYYDGHKKEDPGYWFEYDSQNNPMYGRSTVSYFRCFTGGRIDSGLLDTFGPFVSQNNCTKLGVNMHKDGTYDIGYLYDEDGYPIKQTVFLGRADHYYIFYYEYE